MLPEKFLTAHREWLVTGLVGLVLIVAAVAVLRGAGQRSSSSSTQPKITWSENHIEVIVSPGESSAQLNSFTVIPAGESPASRHAYTPLNVTRLETSLRTPRGVGGQCSHTLTS